MQHRYSPEAEAFRERVRAFLAAQLPAGWTGIGSLEPPDSAAFVEKWRRLMHKEGLLGVTWPVEYGGAGLSKIEQVVLAEECARVGVPTGSNSDIFSIKMIGNTIIRWGTEEQQRRFLPRILSGDDVWCQGFSEPDAGSDLASLKTTAVADGDEWRINGQKIWTSLALDANWIFLLARTEPSAVRHRGLSLLLCPIDQHGVEIRPIKMLSGMSEFNEVFFTDARTALDNVVGPLGGGWNVAMTVLGHERGEDAAIHPILFRKELDRLFAMARERGKLDDPLIRDRLADCYVRVEIMRFLGHRILSEVMRTDGVLGPQASISKLYWSEYHQRVTDLALQILGPDALVPSGRPPARPVRADDPGAPNSTSSWIGAFYNATAGTIYAGSSEIQRRILAESVLGLPKDDIRSQTDMPSATTRGQKP